MFGEIFSKVGESTLKPECTNMVSVSHSSRHCNANVNFSKRFQNYDIDFEIEEKIGKIGISLDNNSKSIWVSPVLFGFNPILKYGTDIFSIELPFRLYECSGVVGQTSSEDGKFVSLFFETERKIGDTIIQGKLFVLPIFSGSIFMNYKGFSVFGLINIPCKLYKAKAQYDISPNTKTFYELYIKKKKVIHQKAGISTDFDNHAVAFCVDIFNRSIKSRILSQVQENIKCCSSLCYNLGGGLKSSFGTKFNTKYVKLFANINSEKELFLGAKSEISKSCKINLMTKLSRESKPKIDLSISFDH